MAKFNMIGSYDDFMKDLSTIDLDIYAPTALRAVAPIVSKKMKELSEPHKDTGKMQKSIRCYKPRKKGNVHWVFIGPSGVHHRKNGSIRNQDKMIFLEFGIKKYNRPATPIVTPTVVATEDEVIDTLQELFNNYLTSLGL